MYRWLSLTILMTAALAGCESTGKKSTTSGGPRPQGSADTAIAKDSSGWKADTGAKELDGTMLAGRVVNTFGRPLPDATIRIMMVPEEVDGKPVGAPIELSPVQPDRDGYFVISNLKSDRNYLYIANARDGEQSLATFGNARPPMPRMVLELTAQMARDMPKVDEMLRLVRQGKRGTAEPPAATLETPQAPPPSPTASTDRAQGWEAQIETPVPGREPIAPTLGSARPPGYVGNPSPWPPPARIDPPPPKLDIDKHPPPVPRPGDSTSMRETPTLLMPALSQSPTTSTSPLAPTSAKRPYCDLEGNTLKSFAVRDLSGQLYEFRRDQHAKLVLLQFWHTACAPCRESIPHLKRWQSTYGGYGLEVIGICYEKGSIAEQAKRVETLASLNNIQGFNYRVLLGGDSAACPLHNKLDVEAHPTFVLLDQTGRIVYHSHDHGFDAPTLERTVRDRLGIR